MNAHTPTPNMYTHTYTPLLRSYHEQEEKVKVLEPPTVLSDLLNIQIDVWTPFVGTQRELSSQVGRDGALQTAQHVAKHPLLKTHPFAIVFKAIFLLDSIPDASCILPREASVALRILEQVNVLRRRMWPGQIADSPLQVVIVLRIRILAQLPGREVLAHLGVAERELAEFVVSTPAGWRVGGRQHPRFWQLVRITLTNGAVGRKASPFGLPKLTVLPQVSLEVPKVRVLRQVQQNGQKVTPVDAVHCFHVAAAVINGPTESRCLKQNKTTRASQGEDCWLQTSARISPTSHRLHLRYSITPLSSALAELVVSTAAHNASISTAETRPR